MNAVAGLPDSTEANTRNGREKAQVQLRGYSIGVNFRDHLGFHEMDQKQPDSGG